VFILPVIFPPDDFDYRIRFDTIGGVNADKIPLIEQVESEEISVDTDEGKITGKIYTLVVREGEADKVSPSVVDSIYVNYRGFLLNGSQFDGSLSGEPLWFDLTSTVTGFSVGAKKLKPGSIEFSNPDDGSFSIENFGIGAIFMPSVLGYSYNFNDPTRATIPVYSPLIFTMDLLAVNDNTDHDNDGILSKDENLGTDGLINDNDTDEDSISDYLDTDDDNDGIPTRDEIGNGNGTTIPYPDTDNDGTPDYLDSDS